jgi:hypothetical protein
MTIGIKPVPAAGVIDVIDTVDTAAGCGGAVIAATPTVTKLLLSALYKLKPDGFFKSPKMSVLANAATAPFHAARCASVNPRHACDRVPNLLRTANCALD